MVTEEICVGRYEYRKVAGELHRRPVHREHLQPSDAAWLVLNHDTDFVPDAVTKHFDQAKVSQFAE